LNHYCKILDVVQISENDFKVICLDCGKIRYWNSLTTEFYDKIHPSGADAEYNPITLAEYK
jgi:hypothetical protein